MKLILLNLPNGFFIVLKDFPQNKKVPKLKKIKFPVPGALFTFIGEGRKFSLPLEKNKNFPWSNKLCINMHYSPSGPIFSMSKLKRKEIDNDKNHLSLPDTYKYNLDKTHISVWTVFPIWSFRKTFKNKKIKSNIELGIGKYKIKTDTGLELKYTIGKKLKKLKRLLY